MLKNITKTLHLQQIVSKQRLKHNNKCCTLQLSLSQSVAQCNRDKGKHTIQIF